MMNVIRNKIKFILPEGYNLQPARSHIVINYVYVTFPFHLHLY